MNIAEWEISAYYQFGTGRVREYRMRAENVIRKLKGWPLLSNPSPFITYNRADPEPEHKEWRWLENISIEFNGLRCYPVHDLPNRLSEPDFVAVANIKAVANIEHSGWYLDAHFQDETAYGVIVQLPSKHRQRRFVPGLAISYGKTAVWCDFGKLTSDLETCQRWADGMAERFAEEEWMYREEERRKEREEEEREAEVTAGESALVKDRQGRKMQGRKKCN